MQYTGGSGAANVTAKYTSKTVQTNFGCSGVSEFAATAEYLVTEIDLPDGTKYQFTYETTPNHSPNVTGRIASVTLPTGGAISYAYSGGSNGITCADGSTATLSRTTPDSATAWTYAHTESGTSWTTTLTDPLGNATTYTFQNFNSQGPYETERTNSLETAYTCYNGDTSSNCSNSFFLPITERQITATIGSVTSRTTTYFNRYGLPTEVDHYGFGSGAPGALIQKQLTTYDTTLTNNIVDRPSSIVVCSATGSDSVCNGSGTMEAETTFSYDGGTLHATTGTPQHLPVTGSRGNTTAINRYSSSSSYLSQQYSYYDTGNVYQATDPNNAVTTYAYSNTGSPNQNCSNSANSLLTNVSVTQPVSMSTSFAWDCNGGVIISTTDANSQQTSYAYADPFWRQTTLTPPATATTNTAYCDFSSSCASPHYYFTDVTLTNSNGLTTETRTFLDGLGRVFEIQPQWPSTSNPTYVGYGYDALGRLAYAQNPHLGTSSPTDGQDNYTYDALGRLLTVTHSGDNNVQYFYYDSAVASNGGIGSQLCSSATYGLATPTLFFDEAGKKREIWADALGRLIEADEVDGYGNLSQSTCYSYNPLGNLISVYNGYTRTYQNDMLSRLTSEATPETFGCATTYSYNSKGDLASRTAPKPNQTSCGTTVVTTYSFDALHRLSSKTYSDGTAPASFFYDSLPSTTYRPPWSGSGVTSGNALGRLTLACTSSAAGDCSSTKIKTATVYNYEAAGRIKDLWECTPYNCSASTIWHMGYTYDTAGNVSTWSHPDGFTVTNGYDSALHLTSVTSNRAGAPSPLATLSYGASWQPATLVNGTVSGGTARQETYDYNHRLQTVRVQLGTSTTPNANYCLVYNYYSGYANPTSCTVPSPPQDGSVKDNGDVMGYYYTDAFASNPSFDHTASYTYDVKNRLSTAQTLTTDPVQYNLTFGYDRYANFTCVTNSSTNGPCPNLTYDGNNHVQGWTYDAAGNLTHSYVCYYNWDGENRLAGLSTCSTESGTYDAFGNKAEWVDNGVQWEFLYDAFGQRVGKNGQGTWSYDYLPLGAGYFGEFAGSATYFNHRNLLGSTTMMTDQSGSIAEDALSYPWGQSWQVQGSNPPGGFWASFYPLDRYGFLTTPHRDYDPTYGLWFSPDPAGLAAVDLANPQSLNRHAYVLNNPTTLTDPLGLSGGQGPPVIIEPPPPPPPPPPDYSFFYESWRMQCAFMGGCGSPQVNPDQLDKPGHDKPDKPTPNNACIKPSLLQRAEIAGISALATATGMSIGIGVGASGGVGGSFANPRGFKFPFGVAGGLSRQLVVSPGGSAGLVTTFATNSVGLPGPTYGIGAVGGFQISLSNATSPQALGGFSTTATGGFTPEGAGIGVGVDISLGSATEFTLTVGPGTSGFGGAGLVSISTVAPFCHK